MAKQDQAKRLWGDPIIWGVGMKRISPEQAINKECRSCMNGPFSVCKDTDCPLKNDKLKPLKRIQNYCLRCVPEQNMNGVKQCNGEILNPEIHMCSLHPFRLGNIR